MVGDTERGCKKSPCVGMRRSRHLFRGPTHYESTTAIAALGAEIHDPVGGLDHVQVVFDDHHRVATIPQSVQHSQELLDIAKMQSRGGFVEDVQSSARIALRQFRERASPAGPRHRKAWWPADPRRTYPRPTSISVSSLRLMTGTGAKKLVASSTVMFRTSWMVRPL